MPTSRRQFIEMAGAGAGVTMLAGCAGGNGGGGGGGSSDVHFITEENSSRAKSFFAEARNQFLEETGINVNIEYTGVGTSFDQRIATLVQTGNEPEVAQVSDFHVTPWVRQGIAEPMTDIREKVEEAAGSEFGTNQRVIFDGEDYMAPLWSNLETLNYRTDLFQEAGVSPPTTWSEQLDTWDALDQSLPEDMAVANHTGANPYGYVSAYVRMYQNGVTEITQTEEGGDAFSGFEVVVDKGENLQRTVEALEHLKRECEYSNAPKQGTSAMISSYYTEKCAVGEYIGGRPIRQAMSRAFEEVGQHSSITAMPKGPNQDQPRYHGWHEGFAGFSNADNIEDGKKWLEFLLTGDQVFGLLTELAPLHNMPMLDAHFNDDRYRNAEFMTENNIPDELHDYMRDEIKPNGFSKVHETGETPNPFAGAIIGDGGSGNMARKVVIEDKSPETAVKEWADRIRELVPDEALV